MDIGPGIADGSTEGDLHQASARGHLENVKRLTEEKKWNPL